MLCLSEVAGTGAETAPEEALASVSFKAYSEHIRTLYSTKSWASKWHLIYTAITCNSNVDNVIV